MLHGDADEVGAVAERDHPPVRIVSPAEVIAESLGLLPREKGG